MRALLFSLLLTACGAGATANVTVAPVATTSQPPPPATTTQAQTEVTPSTEPTASGIHFGGGDGSAIEKAIVILGAKGEQDGVAAEYEYVAAHYGSAAKVTSQSLLNKNTRSFDMLDVTTAKGPVEIYFDITDYLGKM